MFTYKVMLGVILIHFFAVGAAKANDDYRCVIERVSLAQGDAGSDYEQYRSSFVGKEFTVERASGLMAGILKNSIMTRPEVIDSGSKGNSYKVVSTLRKEQGLGSGSNIYALTILEYTDTPKKPFVFLWNAAIFFGYCEHF